MHVVYFLYDFLQKVALYLGHYSHQNENGIIQKYSKQVYRFSK